MKCLECGNTEKFYQPIVGYRIEYYSNGELSDMVLEAIENDIERVPLCAKCEGVVAK